MPLDEHREEKRSPDEGGDDADRNFDGRRDGASNRVARDQKCASCKHGKRPEGSMSGTKHESPDVRHHEPDESNRPARGDDSADHE